jgi:hypothetical protein
MKIYFVGTIYGIEKHHFKQLYFLCFLCREEGRKLAAMLNIDHFETSAKQVGIGVGFDTIRLHSMQKCEN